MPLQPFRVSRPRNESDFEDWCVAVFRIALDAPGLSRFGRRGQRQGGVDLLGNTRQHKRIGVQAKLRNDGDLTTEEIDADVAKALQHHPELDDLFIATTSSRDVVLHKHVLDLDLRHRKLGKFGVAIQFWEDLEEAINQHSGLRAELLGGTTGVEAAQILDELSIIRRRLDIRIEPASTDVGSTAFDKEIEDAFGYIETGDPNQAIVRLQVLQERNWSALDSRLRFKVLANIGNAYFAKNEYERAADFYLQARAFWDSVDARILEARAYQFRDQASRALEIVDRLLLSVPCNAAAHAIRVHEASASYATLKSQIPESVLSDAQVALALSYKAYSEADFSSAEHHARVAVQSDASWPVTSLHLASVLLMRARSEASITPEGTLAVSDRAAVLEAEALLTSALSRSGLSNYTRGMAFYNRSGALKMLDRREDALRDLDEAVHLLPRDRAVLATYAATLDASGNNAEALRFWRKAADLPGDDIGPVVMVALAESEQGPDGLEKAIASLEEVVPRASKEGRAHSFEFVRILSKLRHKRSPGKFSATSTPYADLTHLLTAPGNRILDVWWQRQTHAEARSVTDFDAAELVS